MAWLKTQDGHLLNLDGVGSVEVGVPEQRGGHRRIVANMLDKTQVVIGSGPEDWIEKQMHFIGGMLTASDLL